MSKITMEEFDAEPMQGTVWLRLDEQGVAIALCYFNDGKWEIIWRNEGIEPYA